jgi:hypothetical protein
LPQLGQVIFGISAFGWLSGDKAYKGNAGQYSPI